MLDWSPEPGVSRVGRAGCCGVGYPCVSLTTATPTRRYNPLLDARSLGGSCALGLSWMRGSRCKDARTIVWTRPHERGRAQIRTPRVVTQGFTSGIRSCWPIIRDARSSRQAGTRRCVSVHLLGGLYKMVVVQASPLRRLPCHADNGRGGHSRCCILDAAGGKGKYSAGHGTLHLSRG